jgi:hypothetical protein
VWFTISHGWLRHTIYTVDGDAPPPTYAEALWKGNSRVLVLTCYGLGGSEAVGYDFDQDRRINYDALEEWKRVLTGKYGPVTLDRQVGQLDIVDWFCQHKGRER